MPQYDLNLRDYWRILRKRLWSVALVTAAFGLLALLFAEVHRFVECDRLEQRFHSMVVALPGQR